MTLNKTVCLLGASLETGNQGVSALAASLVTIVREVLPDANVVLFIGSKSPKTHVLEVGGRPVPVRIVNFRMSPRARLHEQLFWILTLACITRIIPLPSIRKRIINSNTALTTLWRSDMVGEIRGGDSFSDIYGLKRFMIGVIPSLIAILLRKPPVLLPQTFGPYRSSLSKLVAKFILRSASGIMSRDREGVHLVQEMLGSDKSGKRARFCPDVAFVMESRVPYPMGVSPPFPLENRGVIIGLNVSGLLYNRGVEHANPFGLKYDYRNFVRTLTLRLLEFPDVRVVFIPHTYGLPGQVDSDPEACRDVYESTLEKHPGRVHLVEELHDQFRIKGVIGQCDFFVGSRMHSCIAALSQGIPTVAVAYSRKFIGVFDSIGVGNMVVDARSLDQETSIARVVDGFLSSSQTSKTLQSRMAGVRNEILGVFRERFAELGLTTGNDG